LSPRLPEPGRGNTFFVVGIGASAGGLEAVTELLGAVPADTGMAFILVQHLDPSHKSLLPEILAKKTAIPLSEARAGEVVRPGHVPSSPDTVLSVRDGHIDLARRRIPNGPPVDVLFTSLAAMYSDHAIGVVLSGGDSGRVSAFADQTRRRRRVRAAARVGAVPNMPGTPSKPVVLISCCARTIADEIVRLRREVPRAASVLIRDQELPPTSGELEGRRLVSYFERLRSVTCGLHALQANHDYAAPRATDDAPTDREC
jgi:hypothetical protein